MENTLKKLIVDRLFLDIDPAEMDSGTPLENYGVDSFFLMEIVVAIEEEFSIKFDPGDITSETLKSVISIAECIREKQNQ